MYVGGNLALLSSPRTLGVFRDPQQTFCVHVLLLLLLLLFCLAYGYGCFRRPNESPASCLRFFFSLSGVEFAWVSAEEGFTRLSGPKQSRRGKVFLQVFCHLMFFAFSSNNLCGKDYAVRNWGVKKKSPTFSKKKSAHLYGEVSGSIPSFRILPFTCCFADMYYGLSI